jgi:hypothetical protein
MTSDDHTPPAHTAPGYTSASGLGVGLTAAELRAVVEQVPSDRPIEVVTSLELGESCSLGRPEVATDGALLLRIAHAGTEPTIGATTVKRLLEVLDGTDADRPVLLTSADGDIRAPLKAAMVNEEQTGAGVYLYIEEIA